MVWQMKEYILATRPWSLPASLMPAIMANILAYKQLDDGEFSKLTAIGSMVCVFGVHIAGNLVNTYYDFMYGVDGPNSDDKTLVDGILKPRNVFNFSIASYALSIISFIVFTTFTNIDFILLFCLFSMGALLSFFYTGVLKLKYVAFGDLVIILTFGPLNVLFTYASQTNLLSWKPIMASIPLICLTEAILHANNSRDSREDQIKNIITLPIMLGDRYSFHFYALLIVTPFLFALYMGVTHSVLFLLELILFPMAMSLIEQYQAGDLTEMPQRTAQINLLYGMVYAFVFACSSF